MYIKQILLLTFISLLMINCSSFESLGKKDSGAGVDSVLFYQQKDISDPFIDAVLTDPGNEAMVSETLLPPAPEPPRLRQVQGYRVQIFAGIDSLNAAATKYRAAAMVADSTYLIPGENLYKVLVGDYPYRAEADRMKLTMRDEGFSGAWVVETMVNAPIDTAAATRQSADTSRQTVTEQPAGDETPARFKIQLFVTSDETRAMTLVSELRDQFTQPAYYEKSGGVYKVFIGRFGNRNEAGQFLEQVRAAGYGDAWLVY